MIDLWSIKHEIWLFHWVKDELQMYNLLSIELCYVSFITHFLSFPSDTFLPLLFTSLNDLHYSITCITKKLPKTSNQTLTVAKIPRQHLYQNSINRCPVWCCRNQKTNEACPGRNSVRLLCRISALISRVPPYNPATSDHIVQWFTMWSKQSNINLHHRNLI